MSLRSERQYVDQISRYYKPERLDAVLDRPVPAFGGLSRRQMILAGYGELLVRVTRALMTWQAEIDFAALGLTPEVLIEAKARLAKGGDDNSDGRTAGVNEEPRLSDDSDRGSL
jgi:hypothetical protein